eukprot:3163955-Rhodomonas_salina.2
MSRNSSKDSEESSNSIKLRRSVEETPTAVPCIRKVKIRQKRIKRSTPMHTCDAALLSHESHLRPAHP